MKAKTKVIVGQQFGHLTILSQEEKNKHSQRMVKVKCDCGTEYTLQFWDLIRGDGKNTVSCGCYQKQRASEANTGKILSIETLDKLKIAAQKGADKIRGSRRTDISIKYPEQKGNQGGAFIVHRVAHIKKSARYKMELTNMQIADTVISPCHYCGFIPNWPETGNGIDRVDSSKHYTIDNIVPCCKNCNYAKNNMTTSEFLSHIQRIYSHSIN